MPTYCNKPWKTAEIFVNTQHPSWKKLLAQALQTTSIPTRRSGACRLLETRRYIYRSLQNAGIENRSPFSLWQIAQIQWRSKGQPEQIKQLCTDSLSHLQAPTTSFSHRAPLFIKILAASIFTASLLPQTATTYLTAQPKLSILKMKILPWGDQDQERTELPLLSDYQSAAFEPQIELPADTLEALAGAGWIVQQSDSAYTLQLLSVSDKSNLQQFCHQYKICDHAAIYTTHINGKAITRLLYGNYRNHKAAKLAKTRLPQGLAGWARQFSQIKTEL
jgi:hypothetical protein